MDCATGKHLWLETEVVLDGVKTKVRRCLHEGCERWDHHIAGVWTVLHQGEKAA